MYVLPPSVQWIWQSIAREISRINLGMAKIAAAWYNKYTQNLEYIAQNMGQDLLPFISSVDRVRDLTPENIRDGLSDEKRRALRQLSENQENGT